MPTSRSLILITALLCAIANSACTQPRQNLAAVQACVQPWLAGVDNVIAATATHPRNQELQTYRRILANSSFAEPIFDAQGQPGARFLSEVQNEREPWIVILPFCKTDRFRSGYAQSGFIASYSSDYKTLMIDAVTELPAAIRGLYLIHEMRHFAQSQSGPLRNQNSQTHLRHEIDAYELEFTILDALKLPGYENWLNLETTRIQTDLTRSGTSSPNPQDIRLDTMLPDLGKNTRARGIVASEFFMRAVFKTYDKNYSPAEALERKLSFMAALYK